MTSSLKEEIELAQKTKNDYGDYIQKQSFMIQLVE